MESLEKEFVEYIAQSLVEHKDDVHVERIVDDRGILLTLFVNASDMGKVIGKQGETARCIRTLLHVFGIRNSAHISLKINEPSSDSIVH